MKKTPIWPLMAAVLFLAAGCLPSVSAEKGELPHLAIKIVHAGGQCGPCQAGAQWITDPGHLESAYRMARRDLMSGATLALPAIDFERFGVLMLCMGAKPSAGYRLALAETRAVLEAETATLRVDWIEPAPGAMVAQVLSSPCLWVQMPRDGYRRVEVKDRRGVVRYRIDLR